MGKDVKDGAIEREEHILSENARVIRRRVHLMVSSESVRQADELDENFERSCTTECPKVVPLRMYGSP
jgi:hypothetical protein